MAELLPEKNRLRNEYFELWQQETNRALESQPEVRTELGALGTRIAHANRDAFLPNIRHGRISVPEEHKDTNNVAVVPIFENMETSFIEMPSLNRAVPARAPISTLHSIERSIGRAFFGITKATDFDVMALTAFRGVPSFVGPVHLWRPRIYFKAKRFATVSNMYAHVGGAVSTHEYVHSLDLMELDMTRNFQALTELRAYRVSTIVGAKALANRPLTEDLSIFDKVCHNSEQNRIAHSIDSDHLLNGGFVFMPKHSGLEAPGADPVSF